MDMDKYPKCKGKKQSPINIDTSSFNDFNNRCDVDCKLAVSYEPSDCHIINENNIPTIYFGGNSYIVYDGHKSEGDNYNFGGDNNMFALKKATLHTPSMHTINSEKYDLEVMLYHYSLSSIDESSYNKANSKQNNNQNNDKSWEEENKGIIISLFYKIGHDKGQPNSFFSQFMNRIPSGNSKKELKVPVNADWGPKLLLPKNKGFFTYAGSLPKEPCNENWYYIVFEEAGIIGKTLFEAFKLEFGRKKNRLTQKLNGRSISYNNSAKFDKENVLMINEINEKMKDLQIQKRELVNELGIDIPDGIISQHEKEAYKRYFENISDTSPTTSSINSNEIDLRKQTSWYVSSKITIKYTIISISFVLFVLLGYYFAKYIILTGILPSFLTNLNAGKSDTTNDDDDNNNNNNDNNNDNKN